MNNKKYYYYYRYVFCFHNLLENPQKNDFFESNSVGFLPLFDVILGSFWVFLEMKLEWYLRENGFLTKKFKNFVNFKCFRWKMIQYPRAFELLQKTKMKKWSMSVFKKIRYTGVKMAKNIRVGPLERRRHHYNWIQIWKSRTILSGDSKIIF